MLRHYDPIGEVIPSHCGLKEVGFYVRMNSNKQSNKNKQQARKNRVAASKARSKQIKNPPVARSFGAASTKTAKFSQTNGVSIVRHREYVSDFADHGGQTDFALTAYRINAANANLFPWLSQVARGYESYKFRQLKFTYQPGCAATTNGMVCMSVDYDPIDPSPADKISMKSMAGARSDNIWNALSLTLSHEDAKTMGERRYTLVNDDFADDSVIYPARGDPKTYELGYLNFAVTGRENPTNFIVFGELYVEYEVELHTPQLLVTTPFDYSSKVAPGGGGVSVEKPFGDIPQVLGKGVRDLLVTYLNNAAQVALKKGGQYIIEVTSSLSTATGVIPVVGVVDAAGHAVPGTSVRTEYNLGYLGDLASSYLVSTNGTTDDQFFKFGIAGQGATTAAGSILRMAPYKGMWD